MLLGQYGLTEERVLGMTQPELDGWLREARLLFGLGRPQPVAQAMPPPNAKPAPVADNHQKTYVVKRKKAHGQSN